MLKIIFCVLSPAIYTLFEIGVCSSVPSCYNSLHCYATGDATEFSFENLLQSYFKQ